MLHLARLAEEFFSRLAKLDEAIAEFRTAIQINPDLAANFINNPE